MTDAQEIRTRLERAAAACEERGQLLRRLEGSAPQLTALESQVTERRRALDDESADVERLESLSAAKIWAHLKGSHTSDLERETAEREVARYAVAEAEARLEVLRRERASLQARLDELAGADAEYHQALAAKERWVVESGGESARTVGDLAERRGRLVALERETREAYDAGREAHRRLSHAASLLGSAGAWSTWDAFGGGGMLTDMMKYQKVDQATDAVRQADAALGRFSRELADVSLSGVTGVEVGGMMRTFDVWFDNFFTDMAVRSRIQDASLRVGQALQQVEQALAALAEKGNGLQAEIADVDRQREALLRS